MKPWSILAALAIASFALGAYAWAAGGSPPPVSGPLWPTPGVTSGPKALRTVAPSPEAKAVLASLRGYAKWPRFPEVAKPTRSHAHHGLWVVVFHNAVVTGAMRRHQLPLPDGSLIVKQNRFEPDGKPVVLTVMAKRKGRWFWLEATPDGRVVDAAGAPVEGFSVRACAGCHEQNVSNDAVYSHRF